MPTKINNRSCEACFTTRNYRSITNALACISLPVAEKTFIKKRYLKLVLEYGTKYKRAFLIYSILRAVIMVGAIIIPAFLVLDKNTAMSSSAIDINYWFVFVVSIVVTIANGLTELFGLPTLVVKYWIVMHQLTAEGWNYIQLSNRYEVPRTMIAPAPQGQGDMDFHLSLFPTFAARVEKLEAKYAAELANIGTRNNSESPPNDRNISRTKASWAEWSDDSLGVLQGQHLPQTQVPQQPSPQPLQVISQPSQPSHLIIPETGVNQLETKEQVLV